jgi:hypothetical protein
MAVMMSRIPPPAISNERVERVTRRFEAGVGHFSR